MHPLPEEIIDLSIKKLISPEDIIRCSAVCKSWQSIVTDIRQNQPQKLQFTPWLMLSPPNDHQEKPLFQKFFNFANKKLINMELQHTKGRRCWGTPFGWILSLGLDLNIQLFNPLSQIQMSLPSLFTHKHRSVMVYTPERNDYTPESLRDDFIHKLVLSSHPSESFVQVMAIFGRYGCLALAKRGDEIWTSVSKPETAATCTDAVFFKGEFYVVTNLGELMICDTIDANSSSATHFSSPPEGFGGSFSFYLVEMDGNLLIIGRDIIGGTDEDDRDSHYKTNGFVVHKLDFQSKSWIYLETLGDYALFLGNNTSFAISTIEHPNFKGNCIYFTDDHETWEEFPFCDMGVYDYGQDTVDVNIYAGDDAHTMFARPFFFVPSF